MLAEMLNTLTKGGRQTFIVNRYDWERIRVIRVATGMIFNTGRKETIKCHD